MTHALDDLDRSIVAVLQQDGRASNVEIARKLGYSEATIRKRLERLFAAGVIRVTALINPAKISFSTMVVVGIEADLSEAQRIAEMLAGLPEVCSVRLVTGAYDLLVDALLESPDRLLPFLVDRVAAIPGVKRTETLHVLKTVKQACDWSAPERSVGPGPGAPGDVIPGAIVVPS
jgi:Lrp/AsnC family transcriptional regulator for asnA, asnC and gidA